MKPEKKKNQHSFKNQKNNRKRDYDESKIAVIIIYLFINYCKILIRLQHNLQ